ncbi:hypothetical protein AAEX28_04080 [Lentisphaerota bacterium WC36G]|nr:hypothetical protein LJT99_06950 [Lentisphaerae bacterium WC36]
MSIDQMLFQFEEQENNSREPYFFTQEEIEKFHYIELVQQLTLSIAGLFNASKKNKHLFGNQFQMMRKELIKRFEKYEPIEDWRVSDGN